MIEHTFELAVLAVRSRARWIEMAGRRRANPMPGMMTWRQCLARARACEKTVRDLADRAERRGPLR